MILPNPKDALHRARLYQLLTEIVDDQFLSKNLIFKGGTCAALMGKLDRFSVDLDFDIKDRSLNHEVGSTLEKIAESLDFEIKDKNAEFMQYILKYKAPAQHRNTLKIDIVNTPFGSDVSKPVYLSDIDRYVVCQTVETMFSHKLVAITDRYAKHRTVAGRDIYDIYYFFINNYQYSPDIIRERTSKPAGRYFESLIEFIGERVDQTTINEDLNMLLPLKRFASIRKTLKIETLNLLRGELARL